MQKEVYQIIKDVSLVEVNEYECLVFDSVYLFKLLCCHPNQRVQHFKEEVISGGHYLLIGASLRESNFSISCPYELNTKNTNLQTMRQALVAPLFNNRPILLSSSQSSSTVLEHFIIIYYYKDKYNRKDKETNINNNNNNNNYYYYT